MKNVKKQADAGHELLKQNPRLDLTTSELIQLQEIANASPNIEDGIFRAVGAAYYMGLNTGYRYGTKTKE